MKTLHQKTLLLCALVALSLCYSAATRAADAGGTFTVSEGASPWYDRIGQWSLANVPDGLKGTGPLPQGNCSSRSLEVPGKPKSILLGVQNNDVEKFTAKFPAAKDTGDQIAVRDTSGTVLPYRIFLLKDPPAAIDGAGVYGAGLLLLKLIDGR